MLIFRPLGIAIFAAALAGTLPGGSGVLHAAQPATQPTTQAAARRTDPIGRIYRAALERPPKPAERKAAAKALSPGAKGMEAMLISLLTGQEYRKRGRSDGEFVQDAFAAALGREPTGEERRSMLERLDGDTGRLMLLMTVMSTPEYRRVRKQRVEAIEAGDVKPLQPETGSKPKPGPKPDKPSDDKRPTTRPADRKPARQPDTTAKPTTRPAKGKKPAEAAAGKEGTAPEPPAVSPEQVGKARGVMRTAERDLMKLVRDRKVSLDSPRIKAARDTYFRARKEYWSLKHRLDQQDDPGKKGQE
ncbi:MAG: hypothetical protein ACLFV7_05530 [Phycisphaerae bacterium]